MAITVKRITLWRGTVEDRPGALAEVLAPVAAARADLQVVMGYQEPGDKLRAVIELYPVTGKKLTGAVKGAGLSPTSMPALLVSGDNRPGVAHAAAAAIGAAGINLSFLVAQAVGRRYSAVFGFSSEADAVRAAKLIKSAAAKR
jgi:hypothetical protein